VRPFALLRLKRHGGWKSSSTTEGGIEDCVENKIQFARKILHSVTNKEFSKPTTSVCNQEDKENSGYENFDNANVATSPLMLFHCTDKEGPLQELYTGCLIKNASTHNFFIYYPISMNKKKQRYGFSCGTKQPQKHFFWRYFQ
jgi:hypothetical protein